MKNRTISVICITVASFLVTTGIVYATTRNITSGLGGTSGDTFDLDGTLIVDSLKVGGSKGGVTFFNGTILNNTTGTGGADNPVAFGDNVRIDGRVYRGSTAGTSDNQPFIVNDNMEVAGTLTVGGSGVAKNKVYEGTIDLTQNGDETVSETNQGCTSTIHFEKIAIPEIDLNNMPNVSLYDKPHSSFSWLAPNNGDVLRKDSLNMYFDQGYIYLSYKSTYSASCNFNTMYATSGDYKIVVVY